MYEYFTYLLRVFCNDVPYFASSFGEDKFISEKEESEIKNMQGIERRSEAYELLRKIANGLSDAEDREKRFHEFTAIFHFNDKYQRYAVEMEGFYAGRWYLSFFSSIMFSVCAFP